MLQNDYSRSVEVYQYFTYIDLMCFKIYRSVCVCVCVLLIWLPVNTTTNPNLKSVVFYAKPEICHSDVYLLKLYCNIYCYINLIHSNILLYNVIVNITIEYIRNISIISNSIDLILITDGINSLFHEIDKSSLSLIIVNKTNMP